MMARATADALFEWDLVTHRLWWGGGLSGRFGYARECVEFNLEGWSSHIHPEDRKRVLDGVKAFMKTTGEAWSDEFRLVCEDQRVAYVMARGFVIRDENQRPLRITGGMCDITSRRECEDRLDRYRQQLRALSSRLQKRREEDRRRISRDLHDTLGQLLTGLKMDLGWVVNNLPDKRTSDTMLLDKLIETEQIVDSAIVEVQRIATDYRPDVLDNLGLTSAIRCELELFQQRSGIQTQLNASEQLPEPAPAISIGVFRILQEALTNVVRHARATKVLVYLGKMESQLRMEVSDNGKGIDPAELIRPGALGLLGMREHAAMLGGSLEIKVRKPHGTTVAVTAPFQEPTHTTWELNSSTS